MALTKNSQIDLNGNEMILDADGDTTITADTDDQIDFKTAGTDRVAIGASGNLFVGSSTSNGISGGTAGLQVTGAGFNGAISASRHENNEYGSSIMIGKSRNTTVGSNTIVQNNDGIGAVTFFADDGTNLDSRVANISALVDGTPGENDTPGRLVFETTADGSAAPSERMRIDSLGNVGIGDSNPGAKLDVNSGTTNTLAHFHSTDDNAFIELKDDDTTGYIGVQNDYIYVGGAPSRNDQNINIHKTSGNVGISWTAPTARLGILQNGSTTPGMNITDGSSADFRVFAGYVSGVTRIGTSAGSLATDTGGTERIRVDSSGNFIVNGTSAGRQVHIYGITRLEVPTAVNYPILEFLNTNGEVGRVRTSGTATAYDTTSDYRLKENVTYDWDATTRLKQLKPARFNFIADADTTFDGFLAHEVSEIVPVAVGGKKDAIDNNGVPKYQSIDHSKLVPLLVKTIQELEARITTLEGG